MDKEISGLYGYISVIFLVLFGMGIMNLALTASIIAPITPTYQAKEIVVTPKKSIVKKEQKPKEVVNSYFIDSKIAPVFATK